MATMFMSPEWFFGYGIVFEFFFFIISLLIALYAIKVYRTTGQKLAQYFGYGFLLISVAYLIQSISNIFIYTRLHSASMVDLASAAALDALSIYAYMLLMISGLVALLFVSLKSDKIRTFWILIFVSIAAIMLSVNEIYTFYLLASIYLVFIAWHFIENYLKNRQAITLTVALAFIFLGFGTFHYLISVDHALFYVIGHVLDFFAYLMILINWYLVKK